MKLMTLKDVDVVMNELDICLESLHANIVVSFLLKNWTWRQNSVVNCMILVEAKRMQNHFPAFKNFCSRFRLIEESMQRSKWVSIFCENITVSQLHMISLHVKCFYSSLYYLSL